MLKILMETDRWIAVDKEATMSVHNSPGKDLLSLVSDHLRKNSAYPVNRLDAGTSGIVLFGKDNEKASYLSTSLSEGKFKKTYLALCMGRAVEGGKVTSPIEWPISREAGGRKNPAGPKHLRVRAVTNLKIIEVFDSCTLFELEPVTGRKHQLRRHMALIGHPIIGDCRYSRYESSGAERLALHAAELVFTDIDGTTFRIESSPGEDFWSMKNLPRKEQR